MVSEKDNILIVSHLQKFYSIRHSFNPFRRHEERYVRAVDDVSISIPYGTRLCYSR